MAGEVRGGGVLYSLPLILYPSAVTWLLVDPYSQLFFSAGFYFAPLHQLQKVISLLIKEDGNKSEANQILGGYATHFVFPGVNPFNH